MAADQDKVSVTSVEDHITKSNETAGTDYQTLSATDIRHNMRVIIALDAIFTTGVADGFHQAVGAETRVGSSRR